MILPYIRYILFQINTCEARCVIYTAVYCFKVSCRNRVPRINNTSSKVESAYHTRHSPRVGAMSMYKGENIVDQLIVMQNIIYINLLVHL